MTKSTTDRRAPETTVSILALHRGQLIAVAVIGIILGLIGLIFPTEALLFIAIIFGVYLIVAGIFRINFALTAHDLHTGIRWLAALLGLLIVATGVLWPRRPVQRAARARLRESGSAGSPPESPTS
ncbi:MAG: DUF308 domain-containing protein [Galbitalea sp.]